MLRKIWIVYRSVYLRTREWLSWVGYTLLNAVLSKFKYGYFHAKYEKWGGRVHMAPFAGQDSDISNKTVAVLCRKDGKWGKGVALRLAYDENEKFLGRRTPFGNVEMVKYWDFGTFYFEEK